MIKFLMAAAAAATVLSGSSALAMQRGWPADQLGKEASIPFIDTVGIYNFKPDGDRGVWLQDQHRRSAIGFAGFQIGQGEGLLLGHVGDLRPIG